MTKKGSYSNRDLFELVVSIFNILILGIVFGYTVIFLLTSNNWNLSIIFEGK